MICKSTLQRLGKAAFNNLSEEDKQKYTSASCIVAIITNVVKAGNIEAAIPDIGLQLSKIGFEIGTKAFILLVSEITGYHPETLGEAISAIVDYVKTTVTALIDQVKHDIANKLAVLFGIDENPGIIGAIMEWLYRSVIKPLVSSLAID